ncbi:hypothetical protein [Desulfogranum japonicum]|uniref:hypothetical protein n=1 Tax=Desulfogranum japonicum TaxID=231447 RepID=UPI0003FA13EC|nr:hypothetical protein [Desulfogranum japonicum]
MPGCNVFNQEHQMLLVHFYGIVTADDLELQAVSVLSNPDFTHSTRELISFADVEGFAPDVDIERLAEIIALHKKQVEKYPDIQVAIFAPGGLAFNLAMLYKQQSERLGSKGEIKVFTERAEAVTWLGGSPAEWNLLLDRMVNICTFR